MKIPSLKEPEGFKDILIQDNKEPLVDTRDLHPKIHVVPMYRVWDITSALDSVYVRQGVADKLIKVAESLPEGIHLLLWDGWRPITVQQALFDAYVYELSKQYIHLSLERLQLKALDFVSLPSKDTTHPSTHATGGAIDLTLCTPEGEPLDMGTAFNDFTTKTHTKYYDESLNPTHQEIVRNRRTLFHAMIQEGFTNFHNEWWHYDFGNQWWAVIKGEEKAKYGYIELS